ncbi:flagellar hook-length control protein FliK [Methylobacterium sp. J-068]|uniref:flagellar hook-length control protein FliK n=1 Tax=Methylobacterium sp. J-068 TaxID=2836649 RepID=UPI001FB98FCD|nr:flagellar hook-length control protein FliK [Methylobacterium sp. J-068]MCJ2037226.1 flagellar hook-length control protein FliK [Methylobacterium sp. J-068]
MTGKESTGEQTKDESSDKEATVKEGAAEPPPPVLPLPIVSVPPTSATIVQAAASGAPSGTASEPAPETQTGETAVSSAKTGALGTKTGAATTQNAAEAQAGAPLALRVQARAGRADADEGGERAKTTPEGDFAAALKAAPDGSTGPTPALTPLTAAPAATPDVAAPAPSGPGTQAQAPVPLGAVPMTIGLRSMAGSNQFEIRLDPKDLGRIDVNLAIDKETGTVQATLVVDRPETLALLQRDAGNLQQALSQAGLDAPDGSISLSLRNDGGGGDASRGSNPEGERAGARGGGRGGDSNETPVLPLPVPLRFSGAARGLDIRI